MKQTISTIALLFCIHQSGAQSIEDARQSFYYHRYESAKKILYTILSHADESADEAAYMLGEVYLKQKYTDSAYMVMERINNKNNEKNTPLKEAPLTAVGWAHVLLDSGNIADARKLMEAVLAETKYKNVTILLAAARANTDSKNGDAQWALALLEKAGKRDKKNASVYLLKGDAYRKIADGGNAVVNYAEALRKNPSLAETKYKEGLIYKTQNNEEVFLERFTEAYAIDSAYAPVLYQLYAYYFFKDVNKAAGYLDAYLRNTDAATEQLYMMADLDFVSKKYAAAIETARKIIAADGVKAQPRIYKLIAYSMAATGDSSTALKRMTEYFLKQDTAGIVAKDFSFMAKLQPKDSAGKAAAAGWYEKAIAAETDLNEKLENLIILADIEKECKNYPKEALWRGEIFKSKPGATNLDIYKWGTALYAAADYAAADSVFRIYEEKYPAQVYGYLWRAKSNALIDTAMTQGLAVPHYQKLIEVAGADSLKNMAILLNAYGYLGTYEANIKKDYQTSLEYFNKILALDPANEDALKFTATLKKWLNNAAASN